MDITKHNEQYNKLNFKKQLLTQWRPEPIDASNGSGCSYVLKLRFVDFLKLNPTLKRQKMKTGERLKTLE